MPHSDALSNVLIAKIYLYLHKDVNFSIQVYNEDWFTMYCENFRSKLNCPKNVDFVQGYQTPGKNNMQFKSQKSQTAYKIQAGGF